MNHKTCIECGTSFTPSRSDAKTCSNSCRAKAHRRAKAHLKEQAEKQQAVEDKKQSRIALIDQQISPLHQQIREIKMKKEAELNLVKAKYENAQTNLQKHRLRLSEINKRLKLNPVQYYNKYLNQMYRDAYQMEKLVEQEKETLLKFNVPTYPLNPRQWLVQRLDREEQLLVEKERRLLIADRTKTLKAAKALQKKTKGTHLGLLLKQAMLKASDPSIQALESKIAELEKQKEAIANEEVKAAPAPLPPVVLNRQKRASSTEIGGADLIDMEFDTFQLPGELGCFLGDLDRNKLAIALTGDSGAGKSYFSFELTKLFLDSGYSAKYFSLEEGLGKLTSKKLAYYGIGNELKLEKEATLKDIRRDARKFDVIVVDSFTCLGEKPEEFENLRNDFPETIFICIFQKRGDGKIRGGSSILFNSAATIDVQRKSGERIATMKKGRYGTIGWVYSISEGFVISRG